MALKSEVSPNTGRKYCFQLKSILISPDSKKIFLNQYLHELCRIPIRTEGDVYVALADLVKIFSPDWKLEGTQDLICKDKRIHFTPNYMLVSTDEESIALRHAPFEKEEMVYIPFAEVMQRFFGCYSFQIGNYIGVSASEEDSRIRFDGPKCPEFNQRRLDFRREKQYGDVYVTYWMEEEQRLNNYRMYIPFSYDGTKPYKLLVCLHGGGGNSDTVFIRSEQKLQYYAEQHGYILLAPNSYVSGSNYGSFIPPHYMFPEPGEKSGEPQFYTDAEKKEFQVAQRGVKQVLDEVLARWNIDQNHIFVMGNSMGSCGTFHLLSTWPELFQAGVPTGCMPLVEYMDLAPLKGKKIWYMTGTEDPNNPEIMKECCDIMKKAGVDILFHLIGGGYHSDAWVNEIDKMFDFFEHIDDAK